MLRLAGVSRHFGKLQAVQDVSFAMNEGELRAVIGPNGAGKTTFFNLITGFVPPTAGDIWFDDENIRDRTVVYRVRKGIVRTFQITEIFPDLSVYENARVGVETAAGLNGRPWLSRTVRGDVARRVDELLDIVGLAGKADRVVGELAHGDQRVVEIALALAMNPRLLLLDEPTAGMGDTETDHMVDLVRRLHVDRKLSILFIEHDMSIVFGIAQRITVLDQGRVLAEGTPAEISGNEKVRAAYLGGGGVRTGGSESESAGPSNERGARSARRACVLRQEPHPARRLAASRRGRDRHGARPQRCGQDDDDAQPDGAHALCAKAACTCSARTRRAGPPTRSRGSASATYRKDARSSAT